MTVVEGLVVAVAVDLFEVAGIDRESAAAVAAREDAQDFGRLIDCLLAAREARRMTQAEVARDMGTGQSAVSTFERLGSDPRYSTIQRYARAVGARVRSVVVVDGWHNEKRVHATTELRPSLGAVRPIKPELKPLKSA